MLCDGRVVIFHLALRYQYVFYLGFVVVASKKDKTEKIPQLIKQQLENLNQLGDTFEAYEKAEVLYGNFNSAHK